MRHGDLSPDQAVRLLRAKVGELENYSLGTGDPELGTPGGLAADIALIAHLLADHMEVCTASRRLYEAHTENLITRVAALEGEDDVHDLLYTAWTIIANGAAEDASQQNDWHDAMVRWRDRFHAWLDTHPTPSSLLEEPVLDVVPDDD